MRRMLYSLLASIAQEHVCDLVIFLFKVGESLLDATVRPYVTSAVCSDLYYHEDEQYLSRDAEGHLTRITYHMASNTTYTVDFCSRLTELPERENAVQQNAAGVLMAHRVLVNVPAIILGLFCGAWSDHKGRKLPMMAPSVGSCLAVPLYIASTLVMGLKVPFLLAGAATQGIFGKTPVMTMAVNSHVSDKSDAEQRTKRLGRILASSVLGMFVGSLLAGLLQDVSSLLITLCVVSTCHALSVIMVLVVVTETVSVSEEKVILNGDSAGVKAVSAGNHDEKDSLEKKKSHSLFSWRGFKDSITTVLKSREGNKRAVIVVAIVGMTLNTFARVGDQDITVLFVQQPPLSWPQSLYGYLLAVGYAIMGLSLMFLIPVLSDVFGMSDISIVMLGVACKLIRGVWAGFCTETWMVFTSTVSISMGDIMVPPLRSILSKTVHEGEVGKLFSVLASMETLAKLLGSAIFTGIYALTVHVMMAAPYFLEAATFLILLTLMLWLGHMLKEDGAYGLLLKPVRRMLYSLLVSIAQEHVCDLVIFLFKVGESLLDATVCPYLTSAVCSDLYYHEDEQYLSRDAEGHLTRITYRMASNTTNTVDFCSRLTELPEIENTVQQNAAGVLMAHRVLVNVPAIILSLFCGAWSDHKGRKLPMMAPSVGSCLAVPLYIASTLVMGLKVPFLLAGAATQGVFGKTPVMNMAVNSHVSDKSDAEQRTKRLGRILASSVLGMFVGSLLAGLLQDVSSLLTILCVASTCHALSVIMVLVVVTETVSVSEEKVILNGDSAGVKAVPAGNHDEKEDSLEKKKKSHSLFSWRGFKDSITTVLKSREGNKRAVVVVAIVGMTLNTFARVGDQDITVLFVQQPPLSWPQSLYGYLLAVGYAIMGLSLMFLIPILSDVFGMSDISIVMLGVACKLIRGVWAGFCTETWMVFTSTVSVSMGDIMVPPLRSILSKTVHEGEIGKLFSVLASMETLAKLLGSAIFTGIYALTVHVMMAAPYFLEAATFLILLTLMLWLGHMLKEDGAYGLLLKVARPYYSVGKTENGVVKSDENNAIP